MDSLYFIIIIILLLKYIIYLEIKFAVAKAETILMRASKES
jgi:hypothetical protein